MFFALSFSLFALSCRGFASGDSYYSYLQGMQEERAGHPDKALEAYEKVVQEDPQALQAFRDIAELRLRLGQPDAALSAAQHVKDLAPSDPASFIFLGNVFVAQGSLSKAAEAYAQALKLDPDNLRALENLGNYYALLDPDKALSYYQRYLELDSRDADIYFQMALVYQKRGNLAKAQELYKQSLELDPDQLATHMAIADLYEQSKSTAAAIQEYKDSAELQPNNPIIFMKLGSLYFRDGQWDEARETFKTVELLSPQEPSVHYWLARIAEEKKDWKEASAQAEKAYTLSQDPQFLPLAAYYLTLDRQVENAVKYLEKAKETDPNSANILLFLGMDYLDLNKPEKAHENLAKGVSLYPKDEQLRFQLALSEDRMGHFDEAAKNFQVILTINPKNAAALNYLGYSWADQGVHLEEAEKMLRQAVALDPTNGAYVDSLGWVRLKRGAPGEARELLEKASMLSPDPLIFDHLGDADLADKHPEAALQAWSKALSMDPKNEAVRKKLLQQGEAFLKSPDAKKYLKYLEGNLKQIKNLRSDVSFEGHLGKRGLVAAGKFYYEEPDHALFDVPASTKIAAVQFSLHGDARVAKPASTNPLLSQMAFGGLQAVSQFLSGSLTDVLQVSINPETGVVSRFSRPNPSGGKDNIDVMSYNFIDGLWVPTEMRVQNATTGWEAKIIFSNGVVNESENVIPLK